MAKVVCFGEIMLRLTPPGFERFAQARSFAASYGGAEANVAVSLAAMGEDVAYVTRLPDNPLGEAARNELRRFGVNTDFIVFGNGRMGIYFLEKGAAMRPSKVVYDRAGAAIANAADGEFDWAKIFAGAAWFHFTGITPALSESLPDITLNACREAKLAGLTVSCDLNFRKNLWSEERAGKVMSEILPFVDLVIANEEDADKVFGIRASRSDVTKGKLDEGGYRQVATELADRFTLRGVAVTLRESLSASDNNWSGLLYYDNHFFQSRKYPIHIVDRVGAGDAFGAGLVYALLRHTGGQEAVELAAAASALKHTVEGDFNLVSLAEIKALLKGDASGRVQR